MSADELITNSLYNKLFHVSELINILIALKTVWFSVWFLTEQTCGKMDLSNYNAGTLQHVV